MQSSWKLAFYEVDIVEIVQSNVNAMKIVNSNDEAKSYTIKRYESNSNTKVYVPMDTDLLDHWPNSRSITNNNSVSLASLWNVKFKVWKFSWAVRYLTFTNIDNMSWAWTISAWANTSTWINQMFFSQWTNQNNRLLHVWYSSSWRWLVFAMYNNDADTESTQRIDWNRHLYTFTWNWSTWYNIYVDWVSVKSWTLSSWFQSWNNTWHIWIQANLSTPVEFQWYMSEFFIETWAWSASQVSEFYNKTKKNYWK